MARKWIELNDLSNGQYSVNKNIRYKTPMLRFGLCDCSYAYIFVKGAIGLLDPSVNKNDTREKDVTF